MNKKIVNNILTFVVIFVIIQLVFNFFIKDKKNTQTPSGEIAFFTKDKEFGRGVLMTVTIKNNTGKDITFKNECPGEPFSVFQYQNSQWIEKKAAPKMECEKFETIKILTNEKIKIPYEKWNHALFGELGRYKIEGIFAIAKEDGTIEEKTLVSNEFEIVKEGIFRFIWTRGFYQPIYNILIFFIGILPGNNLWLAIILLTIFIRLVLLIPSQKALHSQRRMQELQPKLNELKEKYAGDQKKIGEETMRLWKENKVNPFGSCLPLLIQFPVLIALFYVVQTGLNPDNEYLLYKGFVDVSLNNINVMFTKFLDLTQRNTFWLPLIVGLLQFLQMKMTFVKKNQTKDKKSEMDMLNNTMLYFMPVMIAVFTASVPSGVGLYWATSTIFGIVQQYVVNRKHQVQVATT